MRSTSAKLEKWFGGIEVNRPSRFMISGSVSSTVLVGVSVCLPFLHIPSPRELNGFSGAGTLAFAIRSGINLILLFARIRNLPRFVQPLPGLNLVLTQYSIRKARISLMQHAVFGPDSFRFGAMLGSPKFLLSPSWGSHFKAFQEALSHSIESFSMHFPCSSLPISPFFSACVT